MCSTSESLATLQAMIIIWPRQLKMKRGRLRPAKEDHYLQDFWKNTSSNLVRTEKRKDYFTYLHCLQCTWVCLTVSTIIIHLNVIWKKSWNKNAAFSPLPVWNWGFSNPLFFLLLRTRVTTLKVGPQLLRLPSEKGMCIGDIEALLLPVHLLLV